MRIILKSNLCANRPYINLKKLPLTTSLRIGTITETGFKSTYIIDQKTQKLSTNENYTIELSKGIEKITFSTDSLDNMLLVEVNFSSKGGKKSAKFKVYFVLDNIKYALPLNSFEDIYANCMSILEKELKGDEELSYIKECFDSLENEEISVDLNLNLERLQEFKDKVDYKRNVDYFVINNVANATSKYDINSNTDKISTSDTLKVLRYSYNTRLYSIVSTPKVQLRESDIVCDFSDSKFPVVSIYTNYGLGKLLDIKNNVIPNSNLISLFANITDLKINVLN